MAVKKNRPTIFLDRDGVLIKDHGYVYQANDVEIFPDVVEGLEALRDKGYLILVVTNQSGVARGYFTLQDVAHCHNVILEKLGRPGLIDKFYVCPHHPKGTHPEFAKVCDCRKPATGMIDAATQEFSIDLKRSFLIGDKVSDIQCGLARGVSSIQIDRGQYPVHTDALAIVGCFKDAVNLILKEKPWEDSLSARISDPQTPP